MFCKYCGRQIDDGSRFCDYCGKLQHGGGANPVRPVSEPSKPVPQRKSGMGLGAKAGIVIAVIVVIGIAIGAIVAFAIPKADDEPDNTATTRQEAAESTNAESKGTTRESVSVANASAVKSVVALRDASKGDLVEYGKYKQSGGSSEEDIEWVALAVNDGHALLLSTKALDCRPISSSLSTNFDVTWEKSDVRDWLNSNFLDAFTEAEVNGIDTTDVEQSNSADGKTQDKVFLLSKAEFTTYVTSKWAKAQATKYAQEQGASSFDGQGNTNWWLRDYNPNRQTTTDDNNFLNVFYDGTINDLGYLATEGDIAIRPAMWVSLDGKGTNKSDAEDNDENSGESSRAKKDVNKDETVALTVEAADGSKLTGTVRRDDNGFVIADSSSREYTIDELKALNLSDAELCIAWNEPFARQGYHFKNPGLLAYFEACDWYVDRGNASNLTGAAAVNNDRLRQIAGESAGGNRWTSLATS